MQQNKNISLAKVGMNRDTHPSQLQNTEYTLAVNVNTSNEAGEGFIVQNEPSNYLALEFLQNYKVVGFRRGESRTYFLLASSDDNPESIHFRRSSIGYVENQELDVFNIDEPNPNCNGCLNKENILSEPLENLQQEPYLNYVELVHDRCISLQDLEQKGINFNTNFPVKKIELKRELSGTVIYFNDNLNPPRYLKLSEIESAREQDIADYLHTLDIPCEGSVIQPCLDVNKMLHFPKHSRIKLHVEPLQAGGNLKKAVYEFRVAYSDAYGNEISEYFTPTNPIPVWTEDNENTTNYAIKLKVSNIDSKYFKFYKVVVTETDVKDGATSSFVAGIYSTAEDTIIYSTNGSTSTDNIRTRGNVSLNRRIDFAETQIVKPTIKKAKGTMVSDDKLYLYGLTLKERVNLQPVVNLFSSLTHWQTSVAKEDLYKDAKAVSDYGGYSRDEVQTLGFRFLFDDGSVSEVYHGVGRPPLNQDLDIIEDQNAQSLEIYSNGCSGQIRNQRWQIFNTASEYDEVCFDYMEGGTEIPETQKKTCIVEPVFTSGAGETTFDLDTEFYDLTSYLEENPTAEIDGITDLLEADYEVEPCIPSFSTSCSEPTLVEAETGNFIQEIVNEQAVFIPKDLEDYGRKAPPEFCQKYKERNVDRWVVRTIDAEFSDTYSIECVTVRGGGRVTTRKVYERDSEAYNLSFSYADDLPVVASLNQQIASVVLPYYGTFNPANRELAFESRARTFDDYYFLDNIHKNALFYTASKNSFNRAVIEVTKQTDCPPRYHHREYDVDTITYELDSPQAQDLFDLYNVQHVRCTVFDSAKNYIVSFFVDLSEGILYELDTTNFTNTYYVVVDAPYIQGTTRTVNSEGFACTTVPGSTTYLVAPPCGCFSVHLREPENIGVTVSWDEIVIGKKFTYTSDCVFQLPNITNCDAVPYKKGRMAYWQSTASYPDNAQLYDSSYLIITADNLNNLSFTDRDEFMEYYVNFNRTEYDPSIETNNYTFVNGRAYFIKTANPESFGLITENVSEVFIFNGANTTIIMPPQTEIREIPLTIFGGLTLRNADLRCENIRHYKLPDNTVAPFIDSSVTSTKADGLIFPLGFNIDDKVIKTMLDVAVNNGIIDRKTKDSIIGWEILKGDNTVSKSIMGSGLLFDMYKYEDEDSKDIYYPNFPFNDLGDNKFCLAKNGKPIPHPYNGNRNNFFTVISPDLLLNNTVNIPSEISVQGYQFGYTTSGFSQVEDHPQWTVLGRRAYRTAATLATAEVALELAINIANYITQSGIGHLYFGGGLYFETNAAGAAISTGAIVAFSTASAVQSFVKYGEYRYNWLNIFRNLGRLDNFASFQHSVGTYSSFARNDQFGENYLRPLSLRKRLNQGDYAFTDEYRGEVKNVNNYLREDSVLIATSEDIEYPDFYRNYDNNKTNSSSSTFLASETGCDLKASINRDVASPYVALKNYIPDQWGDINSIKWLTTNTIFNIDETTSCTPIYGGKIFISKFSYRRKVPLFVDNAIRVADKLPYKYSLSNNIGRTRFYCDYETADDVINFNLGIPFPDIVSNYNFDCQTGNTSFYLRQPSKFYLFVHSVVDFLVESEINCNFREQKPQPKDQFYKGQSLAKWLQEVNLPISEPNTFYYSNIYSEPVKDSPYTVLPRDYNFELENKKTERVNAWIWSEQDNNENVEFDPWLVFKPLNFYQEKTNRGELIDLRSIESGQFLGRYEDQLQVFNQANAVADAINMQNRVTGTGFMDVRPISFKRTDLGFLGTQHTDIVSTPYGHYWVDAKRGRIFQLDQNGQQIEIISESVQGKPTNMKQWFREHLPFKILKYIPNIDVDNKFKGVGMNIWYDDRNTRVFFTKRDYILKEGVDKNNFVFIEQTKQLLYNQQEVSFDNTELFQDVSWTLAYKPTEGAWNSYFTFYPDYTIPHQNYFQVGYNWGRFKETLWSHPMSNASFGVFQGEYNPWVLEFPIKSDNVNKILTSLSIDVEAKRYQNNWDYVIHQDIGVTDMFIYNATNNTGYLVLNPQKTITDQRKYPFVQNGKQHIMTTFDKGKQNVNYFFNRVINQNNNIPHLIKDPNNIFNAVNQEAVSFKGKKVLERLTGEYFLVNLSNLTDSQFNILIKSIINSEIVRP